MRKLKLLTWMIVFFAALVSSEARSGSEEHNYHPKEGYVPDERTAVTIAEAILSPIYGEKNIEDEKPLKAELKKGAWSIEGTLHCPDEKETCLGGVAEIEIAKDDGRVLRVSHGK